MVGKIRGRIFGEGGDRGGDAWMACVIDSMDMSLGKCQEMVKDREAWHAACSPWGRKDLDMTEQLNNREPEDI